MTPRADRCDQKLNELRKSCDGTFQQAKTDVEARVVELEKLLRAIEAKFKAAWSYTEEWTRDESGRYRYERYGHSS